MKTKLTGLAVATLGAATLVLGGTTAASAATVPAHASAVRPAASWHLYGNYPTLADCIDVQVELAWFGAYGGYQCTLSDGPHQYYQLWVYF